MMNNYFIILASGQSKRFNSAKPKQFIKYKNKALFEHSLEKALNSKLFKKIILVINDKKQIIRSESAINGSYKIDKVSIEPEQPYVIRIICVSSSNKYKKNNITLKFNDKLHCVLSLNNLFNEVYSPHISRVRGVAGGVPNPGRFFNINLKYEF